VYDFDTVIDRRGTSCLKWDSDPPLADGRGLLPLWVADMDFAAPPEILQALRQRLSHPVFGYTFEPPSLREAVVQWFRSRHDWGVEPEWIVSSPGVLPSLATALLAFTGPGDGVIIQPPVYYPFALRVAGAGRRVVENPLVEQGGRWEMDYEGLSQAIEGGARALILCSPHNPCSRVWGRDTLARLVGMCRERGVLVLSDEIHCDLVMEGHRHIPAAASCPGAAAGCVTFVSPTKTFNLAGIAGSFTVIPDPGLRATFEAQARALWMGLGNPLADAAVQAAYEQGARWLDELLAYVEANRCLLDKVLRERLPRVKLSQLEGTYLAWLDMRGLRLSDDEITARLRGRAGVRLDEGRKFGAGGIGFQRMNLACPRSVLAEALERMEGALAT
jgi:cysteine-S-conjugate beta-lyase